MIHHSHAHTTTWSALRTDLLLTFALILCTVALLVFLLVFLVSVL